MKVFFKKHGNFFLYGIMPLLFLVITVGVIQFSPRYSGSGIVGVPGQTCDSDEDCEALNIGEFCNLQTRQCQPDNIGCVVGNPSFDAQGNCDCVDDNGNPILGEDCIVCPYGQCFNEADGSCGICAIVDISGSCLGPSSLTGAPHVVNSGSSLWFTVWGLLSVMGAIVGIRKDRSRR